jgi:hypothetical protein
MTARMTARMTVIIFYLFICSRLLGEQEERIAISRCAKIDAVISQIDVIGPPIPRDDEGNQLSQIKVGFTTLYVSESPRVVALPNIQDVDNIFNGKITPLELTDKSEKNNIVGLEVESISFVVFRNERYFLLNIYSDSPDHVMVLELEKIVEKNNVNVFTLKIPFGRSVFLYPDLAKMLINAGKNIK